MFTASYIDEGHACHQQRRAAATDEKCIRYMLLCVCVCCNPVARCIAHTQYLCSLRPLAWGMGLLGRVPRESGRLRACPIYTGVLAAAAPLSSRCTYTTQRMLLLWAHVGLESTVACIFLIACISCSQGRSVVSQKVRHAPLACDFGSSARLARRAVVTWASYMQPPWSVSLAVWPCNSTSVSHLTCPRCAGRCVSVDMWHQLALHQPSVLLPIRPHALARIVHQPPCNLLTK